MKTFQGPVDLKGSAGTFSARVYVVDGPPDADGDVIARGAIADGHKVRVSLDSHDTLLSDAAAAGAAELRHVVDAVHASGVIDDSARGQMLRAKLLEAGPGQQWSIGFFVLESRSPSAQELGRYPDMKRLIKRWDPVEISPVRLGACGPTCRTLGAKCRGDCGCNGPTAADRAAVDRVLDEAKELVADVHAGRPPGVKEIRGFMLEPHVVQLAEDAAEAAARDLGLAGSIRVRWFDQKSRPRAGGFVTPFSNDTIWVSAQLQGAALRKVVGHEVHHLAQSARGEPLDEFHAGRYGEKLARSDRRFWAVEVGARIYDR